MVLNKLSALRVAGLFCLCLLAGIVQAAGETTESMGDKIALLAAGLTAINLTAPGVGAIITIFFAGLAITAAAIVWFSLLIRKALLLVAIVLGPIAISGASWDVTRGWFGKWVSFVIALILSKLVLVVVFLVAITQVSQPIDFDLASIADPIAGIVLMFVAAFAPYITYKFLSFVGFDMYHAMSSEQEAKSALNRVPGDSPMPFACFRPANWSPSRPRPSTVSPWQSTPSRTPCPKIQANSHRGRAIRRLPSMAPQFLRSAPAIAVSSLSSNVSSRKPSLGWSMASKHSTAMAWISRKMPAYSRDDAGREP